MKKQTKVKQGKINNALLASLETHSPEAVPKPSNSEVITSLKKDQPKTSLNPKKRIISEPKSEKIKQEKRRHHRHQARHSLLLTDKDHEAIRYIRIMFLNAGYDNINISRILKMGLRLLPKNEKILFHGYQEILAEDARVKSL